MKKITESERIIMKIIWDAKGTVTSGYVLEHLPKDISWKMTTVTTFLSRLVARGMILITEHKGRTNYYVPAMSEDEYSEKAMRDVMHGSGLSSIKNLIASLYESDDISRTNIAALRKWLQEEGYDKDNH